jgi:hypothetical protein
VSNGDLAYNGSTTFWTCPTGDHGGWNIYSKPVEHQDKCVEVWLKVNTESGNCGNGNGPKTCTKYKTSTEPKTCTKSKTYSQSTTSTQTKTCTKSTTSTQTSTSTKACTKPTTSTSTKICSQTKPSTSTKVCKPTETPKHDCHCNHSDKPKHEDSHCDHCSQTKKEAEKCPGALSKHFEFPHLIIPVDSAKPSKSYTTSFNGTASSTVSSIFNFDIPASAAGKTCSLDFLFPKQSQLETSAFSLTGSGEVEFSILEAPVASGTTYETKPKTHYSFGSIKLAPGNAYHIAEYECAAGSTIAFELKAKDDTCLNYFQDFNPCPIGLYVNVL